MYPPAPSGYAPPPERSTGVVPATSTLQEHLAGQLRRLLDAADVTCSWAQDAVRLLPALLGPAAGRPLGAGPPSPSFVSDDHSPAELSVSFAADGAPTVRVLVEPGCAEGTVADSGRAGLRALDRMATCWDVTAEPVARVADLFLPAAARGPFSLWCAMDLRRSGPPGVKVYLNPEAHGGDRAAEVVEEALTRFGFRPAWPALTARATSWCPDRGRLLFFALDLGHWQEPRVKLYIAHQGFSVEEAEAVAGLLPGGCPRSVGDFCRTVGGGAPRFDGLPLVSCLSFTRRDRERPSGHTLHVPVRDYVRDDRVARDRAAAVLGAGGAGATLLDKALTAMTSRRLSDGVGLISYVSFARSTGGPPRVTVYLSPEAYAVHPPHDPPRDTASGKRG
ncbi:tryptophan dimethylallyltransferase family protein [Streptomyces sp. NPDC033538]|uniref:tryptophan dimethylallyltransferase family protein n=1 Tax=Streptomyces sp. NPDC033538 TaxID=3155367 RepID=UPI0033DB6CCE